MYPVYARKDVNERGDKITAGAKPVTYLDAGQKALWEEQGAVLSLNRGRDLYLLVNLPPRVQRSQAMGPGVIEGNAANKYLAQELTEAWRLPTWAERQAAIEVAQERRAA